MITFYAEGTIAVTGGTRTPRYAVANFTFTNSMANANTYGLHSSIAGGTGALTAMTSACTWTNNVIAGGWGPYPAGTTLLPLSEYPLQFDANYFLVSTSPFRSMATDGTDLGWNAPDAGQPAPPPPDPAPVPPTVVPVAILTGSLGDGRQGTPYSAALTANGGSGSFTWSLASGTLPSALTLDSLTGTLSGTPTALGTSTFTIRVSDAADATNAATAVYAIGITAPVSVATTSLPAAKKGQSYSFTLLSANAQGPVTWTIASGGLPGGLLLDATTGTISGRAHGAGTRTFTVKVTDANSSGSRTLSLTVDRK